MHVHVLARSHSGLAAAVRRACRGQLQVSEWERQLPPNGRLATGDVLVIDVCQLAGIAKPCDLERHLASADLFAVVRDGAVDSGWLTLAAHPKMHLVVLDGNERGGDHDRLVEALSQHLYGPSPLELVDEMASRDARFADLLDLVRAVCSHPWAIRHAAELSAASGLRPANLTRRCRTAGFRRVEHFLTAVRVTAHSALVERFGVPSEQAWACIGVRDLSNFRRQIRRASPGSRVR